MNNKIIAAVAALTLSFGCTYISITAPAPTMEDAGPVAEGDAGLPVFVPDAGPSIEPDAGTRPDRALRIIFDGPADTIAQKGSQDAAMYYFSLTAYEHLEIRRIPYVLEGFEATDLIVGSEGREYFRDHKIKDADTNATVMGPMSPGGASGASRVSALFADPFVMRPGETRRFVITMDVTNGEDAFGELFGDGNNRYRVVVGDTSGRFFPTDGVRRVVDGSFVEPEAIENNVRIVGNWINVVDAGLTVTMAPSPRDTDAVSHELNIPSVGVILSASEPTDAFVRSIRFSGMGDVSGAFAPEQLNDVIAYCALFTGGVQVGRARTPDAVTGEMLIEDINVTVDAGESLFLVLQCTADSVVLRETGDRYAVGIAAAAHVVAERPDGYPVIAVLGDSLVQNATDTPLNIVTVREHATVTVEANNLRQSTILVADPTVWQNMAQFRVVARHEDVDLEVLRVASHGDAATVTEVAVAADGAVLGTGILPVGTNSERDVHLDRALRIPRDSSRIFQLWARTARVVSSASVGGATSGVPRSGNRISLGIAADVRSGDWDTSYAGQLNIRFRGTVSGDRPRASGSGIMGNSFVVRRTKPTITRWAVPVTRITNGYVHMLYRFHVTSWPGTDTAVLGFTFNTVLPSGATLTDIRLRRNDGTYPPITTGFYRSSLEITLHNEEIIRDGVGQVYVVEGRLDGFAIGEAFSMSFSRDLLTDARTGYPAIGMTGITFPTGETRSMGLVWSDLSEVPHFGSTSTGGSFDWMGDALVEDLTEAQHLTR